MSISNTLRVSGNVGSLSFSKSSTVSAGGEVSVSETLAAAKVGQLTTRTNTTTGTLTMAASHGITDAAKIDLYWTEGGVDGRRYNVVVGTVSTNSVPISGGSGDNLPTNLTAITAQVQVVFSCSTGLKAATLIALLLATSRGHSEFRQADNTVVLAMDLVADQLEFWNDALVLHGSVPIDFTLATKVALTQASSAATAAFQAAVTFDAG